MELERIFGIRAIMEAIESDQEIAKLYLLKDSDGVLFKKLDRLAKEKQIVTSYVPKEKIDHLGQGNHQGAVATISPIKFVDLDSFLDANADLNQQTYLLLDGITDVRNFGAIIRTAECTGVTAIVISEKSSAPVNATTIKTSAGAAFNIPICKVNHLKDAIYLMQAYEIQTIGANEKASQTIYDVQFKQKTAIVMGSEDRGINPSTQKLLDQTVKLPIRGAVKSLNVSVACGVFLYEVLRRQIA
ncbi:MAG: 23S rRNA (guanosine(2251)-2'-O)-methyltransferase RlmB [Nonlabens sp.]